MNRPRQRERWSGAVFFALGIGHGRTGGCGYDAALLVGDGAVGLGRTIEAARIQAEATARAAEVTAQGAVGAAAVQQAGTETAAQAEPEAT